MNKNLEFSSKHTNSKQLFAGSSPAMYYGACGEIGRRSSQK